MVEYIQAPVLCIFSAQWATSCIGCLCVSPSKCAYVQSSLLNNYNFGALLAKDTGKAFCDSVPGVHPYAPCLLVELRASSSYN